MRLMFSLAARPTQMTSIDICANICAFPPQMSTNQATKYSAIKHI